jgi:DNA-binding PadR family transcriptional regulator
VGRSNVGGVVTSEQPRGLRRANDPPVLILTSLADGPKHGHALARDIEDFAAVRLGPGALYGAITRLEQRGLIEPLDSDDRRRPYRITEAGAAALAGVVAEMRRLADTGAARLGKPGLAEGRPA